MDFEIIDHSDEINKKLDSAINDALLAVAIDAEGKAIHEISRVDPIRVDTGRLKNSITHAVDEENKEAIIGSNVEYAIYVHEGTRKMQPNRFLRNAMEKNQDHLIDILESEIKKRMQ